MIDISFVIETLLCLQFDENRLEKNVVDNIVCSEAKGNIMARCIGVLSLRELAYYDTPIRVAMAHYVFTSQDDDYLHIDRE